VLPVSTSLTEIVIQLPFDQESRLSGTALTTFNNHALSQTDRLPGWDHRTFFERNFLWLLAVISIASLIPRLFLGASQYISYDGYWHIFIATQDRWRFFWVEIRDNAHPPLFYFLLRCVTRLGHSHLIYRAISISAGATATYVFGLIAAKVCRSQVVALLAAAAYGFALTNIDLTIDVRSYPIALLFSLLAFHAYLDYLAAPLARDAQRAIVRFGCFATLAIMSEYYAIFFLAACLVIPWLRVLVDTEFGQTLIGSLRRYWRISALTSIGMVMVIATLYIVHLRYQPEIENNVSDYYWDPHSGIPLWRFLIDNLRRDIEYFFPLHIRSNKGLILFVGASLPTIAYLIFLQKKPKGTVSAMPPAIVLALFCQLMILSAARRYPFGGEMRQQSILAPFFILTGFVILDGLVSILRNRFMRTIAFILVLALIIGNFVYGWSVFPKIAREIDTSQYDIFRSMFPNPHVIYVDQLSQTIFFIHDHESRWVFEKRYDQNSQRTARGQQYFAYSYRTTDASGQPLEVFRDRRVWNFDLSNPGSYQWLATSFRMIGLHSAILFLIPQFGTALTPEDARAAEDQYRKYANEAGLIYGQSYFDGTAAFIEFTMEERTETNSR
jgi:hypothetical protein